MRPNFLRLSPFGAVFGISFLFLTEAAIFADWPIFRGDPLQTGVGTEKLPDKLQVKWTFPIKGGSESTAAIVKGVVYVGGFDGFLRALDLKSGKEKWAYKAAGMKAPPTFHDGKIYIGDEEGMFHCVDASDGKAVWTFETGSEITGGANVFGNRILIGSHDSTLYCLEGNAKAPVVAWKFKTMGPVNGSPLVADGKSFVAGCDSILHTIDIKTGKSLSEVELSGQAGATAAAFGGIVYVGNMNNQMQAVDVAKREILWSFEPKRSQPFYSSAAVTDRLVVVGSRDRKVHALDRATGKPAWSTPTDGRVDSSPVIVGGRVYVGSSDGALYVLGLGKGEVIQRIELGRSILASPAISDGMLVISTTDTGVIALGQ